METVGYHPVWDHSQYTYASSYLAMVTGIVCAATTYSQWSGIRGEKFGLCWQTVFTCLFQGVGFGMAGIAFHIVDTKVEQGQFVQTDIWDAYSDWIFPWAVAVVVKCLCSGCLMGIIAAYLGSDYHRFRAVQCANVVGFLFALFEVYLVATNQIWRTARPEFYWSLFATGVSLGATLIMGCRQVGVAWVFSGLAVRFMGYIYAIFGPCDMIEVETYSYYGKTSWSSCPFPQDASKDMVFNCCMALSVVLLHYGAVVKSKQDREYQELLEREAEAKRPKGDWRTRCCSGN